MTKRSQKSLRKIKLLLLLIVLTIILAITATYAWFSSQREVEITGMKINVEVAESMQISLDGEHWVQSITLANMRQFYGTYSVETTHQANEDDNTNYVPTELLPVSTIGEISSGKLQFMTGEAQMNSTGTTSVTANPCSETDLVKTATVSQRENGNKSHPYLVFDMYLRNYSRKEADNLRLNTGSRIWVNAGRLGTASQEGNGKEGTGLENCVRVGMVIYENTTQLTSSGETIRGLTSAGTNAKVAIWEPNDKEHIQEVITNSGRGVQANTTMPTYGIKYSSSVVTIDNVEATSGTNISEQKTMKPEYSLVSGTISATNIVDINNEEVKLAGNKITKVRVYIWLEGQDVDCINSASYGDRLQANLKLTKAQNDEGTQNTYDGEGLAEDGGGSDDNTEVITAETLTAEDYGGYVTNYTASNATNADLGIGGWRIFHSDGENIYLIADDYVKLDYIPAGKGGTAVETGSDARGFKVAPYANYTNSSDISSTIANKWLNKYYTYLNGATSSNNNIRATAYLLDTNMWSGFKDSSGHAEYAIGGPTLELFTASYNKTHETDIETQVSTEKGYQLRFTGGTFDAEISILDTSESLYVIYSAANAIGMWVASPSAYSFNNVMRLYHDGNLGSERFVNNVYYGSRVVVSLKSSVKIEKQEDGTYLIVE